MSKILIIGATSAIAEATARHFASRGDSLFLIGRDEARLKIIAADLETRGAARVQVAVADALEFGRHSELIEGASSALDGLDVALIAHGILPDQRACETSFETARLALDVNALSVISFLTHLANRFEQQGHGAIAVISSVAGDRGRQSNYVYGTAKGAVSLFLQGLRNRLHRSGVQVMTVKPGFVDTPMTADFRKGLLWARPESIAGAIAAGLRRRADVVYAPSYWRWIMWTIRCIPEGVFKRLKL